MHATPHFMKRKPSRQGVSPKFEVKDLLNQQRIGRIFIRAPPFPSLHALHALRLRSALGAAHVSPVPQLLSSRPPAAA